MNKLLLPTLFVSLMASTTSCDNTKEENNSIVIDRTTNNLLVKEWTGSYGGVPQFDQMQLDSLKPALLKGMDLKLQEIDAIVNNSEAPSFDNTIVPLQKAGKELDRVFTY